MQHDGPTAAPAHPKISQAPAAQNQRKPITPPTSAAAPAAAFFSAASRPLVQVCARPGSSLLKRTHPSGRHTRSPYPPVILPPHPQFLELLLHLQPLQLLLLRGKICHTPKAFSCTRRLHRQQRASQSPQLKAPPQLHLSRG
jgi:hypothetical protein